MSKIKIDIDSIKEGRGKAIISYEFKNSICTEVCIEAIDDDPNLEGTSYASKTDANVSAEDFATMCVNFLTMIGCRITYPTK